MTKRSWMWAAAGLAVAGWAAVASAQGPARRGAGPGGSGFGPDGGRLAERLGLTDAQKAQLKALREKNRDAMKPLLQSARQAREAFRTALEAESPDAAAVGQAALAMHAAEAEVQAAHEAHREEFKAILDPEQREKLERAEKDGPRRFGRRGFGPRRGPGGPEGPEGGPDRG